MQDINHNGDPPITAVSVPAILAWYPVIVYEQMLTHAGFVTHPKTNLVNQCLDKIGFIL